MKVGGRFGLKCGSLVLHHTPDRRTWNHCGVAPIMLLQ